MNYFTIYIFRFHFFLADRVEVDRRWWRHRRSCTRMICGNCGWRWKPGNELFTVILVKWISGLIETSPRLMVTLNMWAVTLVVDWRQWSKRLQRHGDGGSGLWLCRRDCTERRVTRRLRHAFGGSWRTRRWTGSTRYWTLTLSKADEDQGEVAWLSGQEIYQKSADAMALGETYF